MQELVALIVAAATIVILTMIGTLYFSIKSRLTKELDEMSTKNSDVTVLKRLDTVNKTNDPKYAAKSRSELQRM